MVYLNGEYKALVDAKVSVLDRAFLFADAVYEAIPIYNRGFFYLAEHLTRLNQSLAGIQMANPFSNTEWQALFEQLIQHNPPAPAQYIYLQISRGVDINRDHTIPTNIQPTIFIMLNSIAPAPLDLAEKGISAITMNDARWQYCNLKTTALLPNVLARSEANAQAAFEAILIKNNQLIEGAASNIFVIKDRIIKTTPKSQQILAGITRDLVLDLALENHYQIKETMITVDELFNADEVWMTSSTKEILPITKIDNKIIGLGKPDQVWLDLSQKYKQKITEITQYKENG